MWALLSRIQPLEPLAETMRGGTRCDEEEEEEKIVVDASPSLSLSRSVVCYLCMSLALLSSLVHLVVIVVYHAPVGSGPPRQPALEEGHGKDELYAMEANTVL